MPAKGTRKKNPKGKTPQVQIGLSKDLYDELDVLGRANGIINPRNGNGNRTKVIEKLFAQLPVFSRAKVAIEMLLEEHPQGREYAESALVELKNLEIEQAYEEAKIEGDLPATKSGAWIV